MCDCLQTCHLHTLRYFASQFIVLILYHSLVIGIFIYIIYIAVLFTLFNCSHSLLRFPSRCIIYLQSVTWNDELYKIYLIICTYLCIPKYMVYVCVCVSIENFLSSPRWFIQLSWGRGAELYTTALCNIICTAC